MKGKWARIVFVTGWLGMLAAAEPRVGADAQVDSDEHSAYDCGTVALYCLFQLEGRPKGLAEIRQNLPAMPAHGYSMKELADAAAESGLRLGGVQLMTGVNKLERPGIAYLKDGHYVVVRPVGYTGRLVQVLNGLDEVEVVDAQELGARPNWSGMILQNADIRDHRIPFLAALAVSTAAVATILMLRPRRREIGVPPE